MRVRTLRQAPAGCCSPLLSLSPGSCKRQGQPGATLPGDRHRGPGSPGQSVVTQGSVELKKLPEAVASAWSLEAT